MPEADIYVCTGDMLDNYPIIHYVDGGGWNMVGVEREINPERENRLQMDWYRRKFKHRNNQSLRKFLGSRDAPVVVVRGNHDFVSLGSLFGGDTFEINKPEDVKEIYGLRFGGFRGINYIAGEWSDELSQDQLQRRVERMPKDLDVVCTHAPPKGILDESFDGCLGVDALASYINRTCYYDYSMKSPRLFCFGHIHEAKGVMTVGDITFSNAATTVNVLEIEA